MTCKPRALTPHVRRCHQALHSSVPAHSGIPEVLDPPSHHVAGAEEKGYRRAQVGLQVPVPRVAQLREVAPAALAALATLTALTAPHRPPTTSYSSSVSTTCSSAAELRRCWRRRRRLPINGAQHRRLVRAEHDGARRDLRTAQFVEHR